MQKIANWSYPQWIAHRGGGKLAPENTIAAFKAGQYYGFDMAEFDVKISADGIPFLLHDDNLLRTTGIAGLASAKTMADLHGIDASNNYPNYSGTSIPSLAEVAEYCISENIAVNIEIKPTKGQDIDTAEIIGEVALELWKDAAIPPLFSSFSVKSLSALQSVLPETRRGLLIEDWVSDDIVLSQLKKLACVSINAPDRCITKEKIELCHTHGYAVLVWTVNDMSRAQQLIEWGVEGIITDNIKKA